MVETVFLISCEHGGNRIPKAYRGLFESYGDLLATHKGWDRGALDMARGMSKALSAPLFFSRTSRLLIDLNRSGSNPNVFSRVTRKLPQTDKAYLIANFHRPYREKILSFINACRDRGKTVVHLACHSFTPVLDGKVRRADIGLLYDPGREAEKQFSRDLKAGLRRLAPALVTRCNYPYQGKSDGLTTWLRQSLPDHYMGIEIELNQKWTAGARETLQITEKLVDALSR